MPTARSSLHSVLLWSLSVLFFFRVLAQLIQYTSPVSVLPTFESWQGSGLSYPVLLVSQILILVVMVWGAMGFSRESVRARRVVGGWLLGLGSVYFLSMTLRLVLGLSVLADVPWFAKSLPAFFHMVLASYVLVAGHYHWTRGKQGASGP